MLQLFCYWHPHSYPQHCAMWEPLFESSKSTGRLPTHWELFCFNACFCTSFFTTADNIASAYPNFSFIYFFTWKLRNSIVNAGLVLNFLLAEHTPSVHLGFCGKHSRGHGGPQPQASKARVWDMLVKQALCLCQVLTPHCICMVQFTFLYVWMHYRASWRNQS